MADNSSYFTSEQNRLTAEANLKAKEMEFYSLAFGFHAKAYEKASGAPAGEKKARKAKQTVKKGVQAAVDKQNQKRVWSKPSRKSVSSKPSRTRSSQRTTKFILKASK